MEIKTIHIALGIVSILVVGSWQAESRWNQAPALAMQQKTSRFQYLQNKAFYLEIELDRICGRIKQSYPCNASQLSPGDRAKYQKYDAWLESLRKEIDQMIGK